MQTKLTTEERFWLKVNKEGPVPDFAPELDRCWLWTGLLFIKTGYGLFTAPRNVGAHCFSYALTNGPILKGLEIDHLCRVRACVRPSHLEAVTHKVNMQRGLIWKNHSVAALIRSHCRNGHPRTENLVIREHHGHMERICIECERARSREHMRRITGYYTRHK